MAILKEIKDSLLHLVFPHVCECCGKDLPSTSNILCVRCMHSLPYTGFEKIADNPVEKTFWGRIPLVSATAHFYFNKGTRIQKLMHELKYKGNREVGIVLGKMMGEKLLQSKRFNVDALVPLPLFESKERARGYNQAAVIAEGLSETMKIPVLKNVIARDRFTETQTNKSRIERWSNIEGRFLLRDADAIKNSHVLLIDDVITTGATLESCGNELLKAENTRLSMATLCIASRQ